MAGSKEELKNLLMKVKEENERAGLKLNMQKTMIIVSSPITSWQIDGETMEIMTDFIFLDSKITADGDCSHKIKRYLLLGRKTMTNHQFIQLLSRVQLCDPMDCSMPGFLVLHYFPEFAQIQVH